MTTGSKYFVENPEFKLSAFAAELSRVRRDVQGIDGWLSQREIDFLALLAAYPLASGVILELGSYRGKSTIVLAKGASLSDRALVVTVDPRYDGRLSGNLQRAGVLHSVEIHCAYSWEVIPTWDRPIRLLWHDGAATQHVAAQDFKGLRHHLQDGAIVAFHDVLNCSGERIQVFLNDVLGSAHFGPVGLCGSIGWGQYHEDNRAANRFAGDRRRLTRCLVPLVPLQRSERPPRGWAKLRYKLLRSCVPHGPVQPHAWVRQFAKGS
jgi:predicted O-methyltransferase YrrM